MRNLCRWGSTLVLALITMVVFAAEKEIPAGKVYTDAEYNQVYKLLETTNTRTQFETMKNGMLNLQLRSAPQLAHYKQVFVKFFDKYLTFDMLKKELADIYLDLFTPEEIRELTAFYQTPLGKKLVEKTPELTLRSAQIGQNAVLKHLPELQTELKKAIEADQKKSAPLPAAPQQKK